MSVAFAAGRKGWRLRWVRRLLKTTTTALVAGADHHQERPSGIAAAVVASFRRVNAKSRAGGCEGRWAVVAIMVGARTSVCYY